jgi:hypothetical protein
MPANIFTPESRQLHCDEFIRRVDASEYVAVEGIAYIPRDLEKVLSGLALRREVGYAHLLIGGEPLAAAPFINEAIPERPTVPMNHQSAAYATTQKIGLPWRSYDFWSLYVIRPREGDTIYGVTWLSAATELQFMAVRQMLGNMARLHLYSAFVSGPEAVYKRVLPAPVEG